MARSAVPPLVLLLLGLLLGAVAGAAVASFLFGDSKEPLAIVGGSASARERDRQGDRDRDRDDLSPPSPAAAVVESAESARAERTDGSIRDSRAPAEVVESVAALTRRVQPPDSRRGDKSIRGKVMDTRGRPLAGVLVRATKVADEQPGTPHRSELGRSAPPPPSLERAVTEAVEKFYEHRSDWREATTGADGTYAFTELQPGRFSVQAWREGVRLSVKGDHDHGGGGGHVRPDATVDFIGKVVVAQTVEVLLPDGKSAPTALVSANVRQRGENTTSGWTAEDPAIPLLPGDYELRASLGDPESGPPWPEFLSSEPVRVTIAEGVVPDPVKLELKGQPGVRGRVLKTDGTTASRVVVKLLAQPSGSPDLKKLAEDAEAKHEWIEDGGEFLFRELKPGRYVVGVSRMWRGRISDHAVVDVAAGMVTKDLVVGDVDPSTCVLVRVTDPDGAAVSEVNFQWRVERDKSNNNQTDASAEARDPGTWLLPIEAIAAPDFDPLKPWPPQTRLMLVAWAEGLGSTVVEVFQATRTLDVRFGPPATLYVTVPGLPNSEYAGRVNFQVERAGEGLSKFGWGGGGQPDKDDGVARIGPLEAGRYRVSMWLAEKGGRWQSIEVGTTDLSVAPGDNHLTMAMPALHPLIVRMPAGSEGRLHIQSIGRTSQRSRSAEIKEGAATIQDMPAGEWRLTCSGGTAAGVMHVRVPTGGPIDFRPITVTALRVVVQDVAGQLSTAGLRDGDLVVAIEGKEIASYMDLQLLQVAARMAKSVTLTVQRGSEKVELPLESRWLNDSARLGGSLEPATR